MKRPSASHELVGLRIVGPYEGHNHECFVRTAAERVGLQMHQQNEGQTLALLHGTNFALQKAVDQNRLSLEPGCVLALLVVKDQLSVVRGLESAG